MIFRFMEKYRVPILVVLLLGLVGFGVWTFVIGYFRDGGKGKIDWGETWATYEVGGETHELSREEFAIAMGGRNARSDEETRAQNALAHHIRLTMLDDSGITVSDDEFEAAFKKMLRDPIEQMNDGKYDESIFIKHSNSSYGMTGEQFQRAMRQDMRMAKMLGEINRVHSVVSVDDIYETYRKVSQSYRLKGVFFNDADYVAAAKLVRDEAGNLDADSDTKITKYWTDLEEAKRKAYNKDGAELTADFIGFRFHGSDRDDEKLSALFEKTDLRSKTSLKELTKEFEPSDDDLAKLNLRLDRSRANYGFVGDEFDLEKAFEAKKPRLVIEWKILKLMKKLHDQILVSVRAKDEVDLAALALANNLSNYKFSNIKLQKLVKHEDYPGQYARTLLRLQKNNFLTYTAAVGPKSNAFFTGPVDEVGKHASVWRLLDKNMSPMPKLGDVRDAVAEDYEKARATELRDEAVKAFDDAADAWLEEQLKDELKPIRDEATAAIADRSKDLDAEKDKAEIETITKEENDKAEAKITAEKDKKRNDAFKIVLADTKALVVQEGFFTTFHTRAELAVDREKGSSEEKARSALRKEFSAILDDFISQTDHELGTVSEWVESRTYPGLKGRAILLEKRQPTVDEMALNPSGFQQAEHYFSLVRDRQSPRESIWTFENVGNNFKVDSSKIAASLEEAAEEKRQTDREVKERNEKKAKARKAAAAAAAN
ncbi:MAG: hypothetical protein V3W41_10305 [Planctomycetota bacterium]